MRYLGVVAVTLLVGALAACGTTAAAPTPSSSAATPSAPLSGTGSTTPTTTSSAPSLNDRLPGLVERAAFPRDAMADRGVAEPTDQRYAARGMPKPCATKVAAETGYRPGLYREWDDGGQVAVRQYVVGFSESTGKEMLDQLAAATHECTSWTEKDLQLRVVETTTVNRPDGVEAFLGHCLVVLNDGRIYWMCAGFMAHGNLVSCVTTFSGKGPDAALNDLHALLPRAVERLVTA